MLHVLQLHGLPRNKFQIYRTNTKNTRMRSVPHQQGGSPSDLVAPVSTHHSGEQKIERTVGNELSYPDVPPDSLITMLAESLPLRFGHFAAKCSVLAHTASSLLLLLLLLLLLEGCCLLSLWLVQRWLFLIFMGFVLLNKIDTCSTNNSYPTYVLCSCLLLNIKSPNESIYGELLSLVLQ